MAIPGRYGCQREKSEVLRVRRALWHVEIGSEDMPERVLAPTGVLAPHVVANDEALTHSDLLAV